MQGWRSPAMIGFYHMKARNMTKNTATDSKPIRFARSQPVLVRDSQPDCHQ